MKQSVKKIAKTPCVLLLLLLVLALCGCFQNLEKQEYITIGALLPLTGDSSDEGIRALNGLQLAKAEINESGGILGKKLDIIVLNDRGDDEYAVEQYNKLKEKGVAAIIGSSYSSTTIAIAKAAEQDGLPIISPTASNPNVTKGRRNVFRAIFVDDYQAEVMAHFAYNSLGAKTALVLSSQDDNGLAQIAEFFAAFFTEHGGRITAFETYSSQDNFAHIIDKYAANVPDVIFCPEDFVPAAKLINAVYAAGFTKTSILGTDAWDGLLAYIYHPLAMENVYYSAPFSFDDPDTNVTQFVRKYFLEFSQMPLSGSATAYTSVYILAEAFKKAGSTDKHDVVSAIKTNELNVITGHIKFDANNNPRINVYIIQIKGGKYSTYEKLSL